MQFVPIAAAAIAAVLALSGCRQEPSPEFYLTAERPMTAREMLDGNYNLRIDQCGKPDGESALHIQGDLFRFYESQCRAVSSVKGEIATEVRLSCTGEGESFERLVRLRMIAFDLLLDDDNQSLRYFRCSTHAEN